MSLHGRYVIVTGASLGLGAGIAEEFARQGASLLLCARNPAPLQDLTTQLLGIAKAGQIIANRVCDVSREADVDALVAEALRIFPRVDALLNNAGVYGPMGPLETVDWGEWKEAVAINLFGTVYPCRAILPHFKERRYGKIVNLSGGGATSPLPRVSAYAASKAGVVRFTETLAEELREWGVDVNAIAPGVLNTRLTQQMLDAGPGAVGETLYARVRSLSADGATAMDKSARLCAFLCSAASDGITGKLIAALWDPWPDLAARKADLDRSDIYTLRRILPKDRGKDWGD
jgi:NAD(P)-dependent dehydrogenase (short-subunit alcohol dehydrogenase family)